MSELNRQGDKEKPYDFVEDMVGWLRWPDDTPDWVRLMPAAIIVLIPVAMFVASCFL